MKRSGIKRKSALKRKTPLKQGGAPRVKGYQRSTSDLPELAGRSFPSKLERDRAVELILLQRAGEIEDLRFQVRVGLTRSDIGYKPDFMYRDSAGVSA